MIDSMQAKDDGEIVQGVERLSGRSRVVEAQLIAHLGEMDRRGLYAGLGYSSLFRYCCERLGFSESVAFKRIESARVARRYPVILGMVERGELHLSGLCVLRSVLTQENHRRVLGEARHKSRREIEKLKARLQPEPDAPARLRKLPVPRMRVSVASGEAAVPVVCREELGDGANLGKSGEETKGRLGLMPTMMEASAGGRGGSTSTSALSSAGTPSAAVAQLRPTAEDRYRVSFQANGRWHAALKKAQALLGHTGNQGIEEIMDAALTGYVERLEKKKFKKTSRPRKTRVRPKAGLRSRAIPAVVKRAVAERDEGRCTFVSPDGHRCGEQTWVEFHHVEPYARGGEHSVENVRILCRAHNQYQARMDFGMRWIKPSAIPSLAGDGRGLSGSLGLDGLMPWRRD